MGSEEKLPGKGFDQARGIRFRVVHRRSDRETGHLFKGVGAEEERQLPGEGG